eukprot:gene2168-2462_t
MGDATDSTYPSHLPMDGPSEEDGKKKGANKCHTFNAYEQRKFREESCWENIRERIKMAYVSQEYLPADTACVICIDQSTKPRKANGTFLPLFVNNFLLEPPGHKICRDANYAKQMIFIDFQGRQHLKKVLFCKCQSEAESVVSLGFWPSTGDKPQTAFDIRLLKLLNVLLFECHASLDKLCAAVQLLQNTLLPVYVKNIYKILNGPAFDEFRLFEYFQGIQNGNCTLCPSPGESGTIIEMMDACFGFPRKKSAGTSIHAPRFECHMFADQADVDNFVEKHTKNTEKLENPCQYKAGEIETSLRSKGKNDRYDEKAVFGRTCRHGFPKGFISLKHGECIAYAVYELKRMVEPYINSKDVELKCMYDIACILKRHLE